MTIRKVVIPVAGAGTRLLPVTKSQPKEMLPVGRKPVVQYVVEEAQQSGLRQILFVTGRKKTAIEDHFDRDLELVRRLASGGRSELVEELAYEEMAVSFFYVRQSSEAGQADAIRQAHDFVGEEHFVVAHGDTIIQSQGAEPLLARMARIHLATGAAATIAVEEVALEEAHRYGIVKPAGEVRPGEEWFPIEDLVEKPTAAEAPSRWAVASRYVLAPGIFDAIDRTVPAADGEVYLTDSLRLLLRQGGKVVCVTLGPGEHRYDIGNFETYFKAFVDFALADEKYGYTLRQHLYRKLEELLR
jgi:UTP--glucose-1-phosphate uridylyltransferase